MTLLDEKFIQPSEKISIGRDSGVHEDQSESGIMMALGTRNRLSVSQSSLGGQEEADDCGGGAEDLDPRIQIELEKLNSSTDVINKLELDLEVRPYRMQYVYIGFFLPDFMESH